MISLAGFCLMNRDSRHVEIENDGTDQSAERVALDPRPSTLALASVFKLCAHQPAIADKIAKATWIEFLGPLRDESPMCPMPKTKKASSFLNWPRSWSYLVGTE